MNKFNKKRPTFKWKVGFFMKKIVIGLFIITLTFLITDKKYVVIPEESIRFRIIPNSNSVEDIYAKEKLKSNILEKIDLNFTNKSIEIDKLTDKLNKVIDTTFKEFGYKEDFVITYGDNHFPRKEFKGVIYEEGNYESLVIKIGEGKGDNFWCVLFPPLCNLESDTNTKDVEYKFKVKEIINNLMNNTII